MIEISPQHSLPGLGLGNYQSSYHSSPAMSSSYYSTDHEEVPLAEQDRPMYMGAYYTYNGQTQHPNPSNYPSTDHPHDYGQWQVPVYQQHADLAYSQAQPPSMYPQLDPVPVNQNRYLLPPFGRSQSYHGTTQSYIHQPVPQYDTLDQSSAAQLSERSSVSPSLSATNTHSTTDSHNTALTSTNSSAFTTAPNFAQPPTGPAQDLSPYGIPLSPAGPWRCAYPNCTSRALFTRGCDLRKHYNRHSKHLFCRVEGCPQSEASALAAAAARAKSDLDSTTPAGPPGIPAHHALSGIGFSSKKDRARHEAKHNPSIRCEWSADTDEMGNPRARLPEESEIGRPGERRDVCGRVFSRVDNMKDHVRRVHRKGLRPSDAGKGTAIAAQRRVRP